MRTEYKHWFPIDILRDDMMTNSLDVKLSESLITPNAVATASLG